MDGYLAICIEWIIVIFWYFNSWANICLCSSPIVDILGTNIIRTSHIYSFILLCKQHFSQLLMIYNSYLITPIVE